MKLNSLRLIFIVPIKEAMATRKIIPIPRNFDTLQKPVKKSKDRNGRNNTSIKINAIIVRFISFLFLLDAVLYVYHMQAGTEIKPLDYLDCYKLLLLVIIIASIFTKEKNRRMIAWAFILSSLIASFYSIFSYISGRGVIEELGEQWATYRAETFAYNPAYTAVFITMCLPFYLGMIKRNRNKKRKFLPNIFLCAGITISGLAIALSLSRISYLCVIIIFLLYAKDTLTSVTKAAKLIFSSAIIIGLIVFVLSYFGIFDVFRQRSVDMTKSLRGEVDTSNLRRIQNHRAAWALFKEHPFSGVGLGNVAEMAYSTGEVRFFASLDSLYLQILIERGLPFFLFFFGGIIYLLRKARIDKGFENIGYMSHVSMIVFAICSFIYQTETLWIPYIMMGVRLSYPNQRVKL